MPKNEKGPENKKNEMVFSSIEDLRDPQKGPEIDRRMKAFALGLTKHTSFAEDLVSETYEKAIAASRRGLFEEGTNFMSWLYKIANNAWIDRVRAMRVINIVEAPMGVDEALSHEQGLLGVTPSHEKAIESRQMLKLVEEAIKTLRFEDQEVMTLLISGMSYKEIAEIQGVQLGTVMSRISRARVKLSQLTGYRSKDNND